MDTPIFTPGQTTKISVTSTSQNIAIDIGVAQPGQTVRIYTQGGNAYIKFTNNAGDTASPSTDMPLINGAVEMFSKGGNNRIAIVADTTATVWITPGEGM